VTGYTVTFDLERILEMAASGQADELSGAQRAILRAMIYAYVMDYLDWHRAVWA
jgi:hypothetical protein